MLFRRIACVGVLLAAVAGGVLQIRLMKGAALREFHLLVSQQTHLRRQIAQQDLELAQLRAPWRVADRLSSLGVEILAPAANRPSAEPRRSDVAEDAVPGDPVSTELITQTTRAGGSSKQWPGRPSPNSPKKQAR